MHNKPTAIAFGELLWDVFPEGAVIGGAPANFGNQLSRLGILVSLITSLGKDKLGDQAQEIVEELGLDCTHVQRSEDHPTGTVDIVLSEAGKPDFTINEGVAYDYIELSPELLNLSQNCDLVYFGTMVQRAEASRSTLYSLLDASTNSIKFLDINLRKNCYSDQTITDSLNYCDILKLSDDEIGHLIELYELPKDFPSAVSALVEKFNLKACILSLGDKGLYAANKNEVAYVPGYSVEVVDTVGAGDACSAGFCFNYLNEKSLKECCELANALGAITSTKKGGMPKITAEEISAFLRDNKPQNFHTSFE
ncbi:MAG: carbohydrate kinase [Bdellovibrionota bacterium]